MHLFCRFRRNVPSCSPAFRLLLQNAQFSRFLIQLMEENAMRPTFVRNFSTPASRRAATSGHRLLDGEDVDWVDRPVRARWQDLDDDDPYEPPADDDEDYE